MVGRLLTVFVTHAHTHIVVTTYSDINSQHYVIAVIYIRYKQYHMRHSRLHYSSIQCTKVIIKLLRE